MRSLFGNSLFNLDPSQYAIKVTDGLATSSIPCYDYVIVGGGTAACVLAHRLSENPNITVLVIEAGAGHKGHLHSKIPAAFNKNFKSPIAWDYTTVNQTNVNGRSMYWPSGKVVGGSSMINALMYQRPCADDINEWSKLGAKGWTWDNFKSYLVKAEKYVFHSSKPNSLASYRGTEGLWYTRHLDVYPISKSFIEACNNIGIHKIDDTSGPDGPLGVTLVSAWVDQKSTRSSAAHAYLTDAVMKRPNLTIAINACVTKILTSGSPAALRAIGVELSQSATGPIYRVNARREIICCAGAIKTPQILTLSGIGPKAELDRLGISVVKELDAVGKNLYDHPVVSVGFKAKREATMDSLASPLRGIGALLKWLIFGSGPFAMLVGQAYAFIKSTDSSLPMDMNGSEGVKVQDATAGNKQPDIEFIGAPVAFRDHGFKPAPPNYNVFTIGTVLLRPLSHGSITLKSDNIWDGANIDPNYFFDPNDINVILKGIRLSLRMARTGPLADELQLSDDLEESDDIYFPGHTDPDKITDEVLIRYIRKNMETLYHPMGTAKMGQSSKDSVVDSELHVHGIFNLRVVDASIFPAPLAGHTTATVIGVAERAADIIKSSV